MTGADAIRRLLRRDRALVAAAIGGAVILSWSYLLLGAAPEPSMTMGGITVPAPWSLATFGVMAVMWLVMMAAMMLPSASPMILLFAVIGRKGAVGPVGATGLFALAYLLVWAGFGLAATSAQWGLVQAAVASPAIASGRTFLAGGLLLLAGFYQLSPLKQACLRQCRSPLDFLTRYWRGGPGGAFGMGLRHGLFCLGCCWAMMALLFVGGAMNLLWVAVLALFVLVEKLPPAGRVLGRAGGVALILWGSATLLTAADPAIWIHAFPGR